MPYSRPIQWSHGDWPHAAYMQYYSDSLDWLNSVLSGDLQPMVTADLGLGRYFFHKWRWLHYRTAGSDAATISDPAGIGDDVSLSSTSGTWTVYDLVDVDWLTAGSLYKIDGADYCMEDSTS